MSREMTVADASRQMPNCETCGMVKMGIDGKLECPNCFTANQPKTGQTIVMEEGNGPARIRFVKGGEILAPSATQAGVSPMVIAQAPLPGTIQVSVPVELFAELMMFSKKLKWPKRPEEAPRLKAILEFQTHLMSKLTEISR